MARHVFLHIGDTHLQPGPRQADRLEALRQIVRYADDISIRGQLAAIVWPGDLYHAKSTVEDRNALVRVMCQLADLAPVLVCPGNHDQPGDLDMLSALSAEHNVHVRTMPGLERFPTATGRFVDAFVLPYPHKSGLVAAGVEHGALPQTAAGHFDAILIAAAADLEASVADGRIALIATHINVAGAVSSVGQPQIGQEIELDQALLARLPGPVAVMANHIHKHQQVGRAVYAGSISRQDYGEQEPKGFVEWTWDDEAGWSWRFIELATPRQLHVEGRLSREGSRL